MKEDQIKEAFLKVKEDILALVDELSQLGEEIDEIKEFLSNLQASTHRHIPSTHPATSTQTSTVPQEVGGLRSPDLGISTGNQGASTDRQTDISTDRQTQEGQEQAQEPEIKEIRQEIQEPETSIETNIQEASEILESLDGLKKEIRLKFKKVTPQEMAVFSTIYQLEEQDPKNTTYKRIAQLLHLSESSIRDYVQRMINKGIPVKKTKIDNKQLILSISSELRKIAPLHTIMQLREI